jgi:thiol-disulfide isomerase/thioredoxin
MLSGRTLDGRQLVLSRWRGHVVVLNVWASWCEPCTAESPALVRVARSTTASGVRFVGIDERDEPAAASDFVRSIRSPYPHLADDGHLLAAIGRWLPQAVPGSLVVDRSGRVAARVVGPVSAREMDSLVRAVLAEG